jgi:predicted GNAT family acetyltransferase
MVYTPPRFRNRGYASMAVATLSQRLLEAGYDFCTLFTDLANPTSNHIYQAIGYRRVCDFAEITCEAEMRHPCRTFSGCTAASV